VDTPLFEHVAYFLREKRMLLILDNFEQVGVAAPLLEELLAACPSLKFVVTSREVLHLQVEREFPVVPLALPPASAISESEALASYSAVALFVQRAQAVLPNFRVTRRNAAAIVEVCTRLDGLPLAIELAASRVKLLPPEALLKRLAQSFQVLSSDVRTRPERHRTLFNTMKWSYDLLDGQEQWLFRRLAIFVGGWIIEAAEAICAARSDIAVLDGVASLLDKSLLLRLEQEGEEPRLQMLMTLREYGLVCLRESGEMEEAQLAHARYYLSLAQEAEPHLKSSSQQVWLVRLEQEQENLRPCSDS
jgi:non-specific serine/threonine protein kinase